MSKMSKRGPDPNYVKAPMTRRALVRRIATVAGIGSASAYLAWAPSHWPGSRRDPSGHRSEPSIEALRLRDYRVEKPTTSADVAIGRGTDVKERLHKALDAMGGLSHFISPGDIVLVKPNVAFDRSPNLGATSNPEIIERLVRMLLVDCRAQEVRIADNPIESPADCFAKSGVGPAAVAGGGRIYLPDSNAFRMLNTPGAEVIENWWFFHRPLTNVDKVIGVAPVKDHNLCGASIGIKNWYGLLGGRRNQFHQDIHSIVSDLAIMLRPTLTIIDGSNVLMENGPTGGDPSNVKEHNAVIAAVDPVAADAWAFENLLERGNDLPLYMHKAELKGAGKVDWHGRIREVL